MLLTVFALASVMAAVPVQDQATTANGLVFTGGRVFDGEGFVERTLFIEDGFFVAERPARYEEFDLGGRYVIPPLSDAHTHRFASAADAAESRQVFLNRGVFYVANLCNGKDARRQCKDHVNRPTGVDVLFANGGITATGGHPIELYEDLHQGAFGRPSETFWDVSNDNHFYVVDTAEELEVKWKELLATGPDIVKALLSYSEEFDNRRDVARYYGHKGLDPELLPLLVEKAHAEGLRLACHVDTAGDFRNAVDAGVDVIAHTPGYGVRTEEELARVLLTAEDARRAADAQILHVTTASLALDTRSALALAAMRENLSRLHDAGVRILFGSDQWERGLERERDVLLDLGVFTTKELLVMWLDTARAIFPERRIGRLEPGYEASLVALDRDPLRYPSQLGRPRWLVKEGLVLKQTRGRAPREPGRR